jgi:isopenicillin-N N-acyltransferase-like protein
MSPVRTFTSSPLPPRERGVEFGRGNADAVRRSVAGYLTLFARRGAPGYDARRWAAEFRDLIGDLEPDALAEIGGIAEGARVDVLDVVAVNARTELLAKADPYGERECSTVVVTPADAPAYGVQTWDWYASMADTWLRWRIPQPDGSWLETVTEYGLLAKIGVSSRGVGVLLNMLRHAGDDNDRVGLPVHLLSRRSSRAPRRTTRPRRCATTRRSARRRRSPCSTASAAPRSSSSPTGPVWSRRPTGCSCAPTTSSPRPGTTDV